jgi:hypothetical protein
MLNNKIKALFKEPMILELIDDIEHDKIAEKIWALSPSLTTFAIISAILSYVFFSHTIQNFCLSFFISNALVWFLGLKLYPRKKVLEKKFIHVKNNAETVWTKINQFCQFLSSKDKEDTNVNQSIIDNIYYIILSAFFKPLDINFSLVQVNYENSIFHFPSSIYSSYLHKENSSNYCSQVLDYLSTLDTLKKEKLKQTINEYFGEEKCFTIALISGNVFLFKLLNIIYDNRYSFDMNIIKDCSIQNTESYLYLYSHSFILEKNDIYYSLLEEKKQYPSKHNYQQILSLFESKMESSNVSSINEFIQSSYIHKNETKNNILQKEPKKIITKDIISILSPTPSLSDKIIKSYHYNEMMALRYELMTNIKEYMVKAKYCSDSMLLSSMLTELNFILQAINEEQYNKVNTYFNIIHYIKEVIPELIDERIQKDSEVNPEWEYQYHEQIKQLRNFLLQTQQIVFNYSFSDFSSLNTTLNAMIDEMSHSIQTNQDYLVDNKIYNLLNELKFIIQHINADYYDKVKNGFNIVYIIKYSLPTLVEQYILASFRKQNNYYLSCELDSLHQKAKLVHDIIVNEANAEYQKNANVIFNKYAEFNFTYLKAHQ